jgi:hypothetical protein
LKSAGQSTFNSAAENSFSSGSGTMADSPSRTASTWTRHS